MQSIGVSMSRILCILVATLGIASNAYAAGDAEAGKAKSALCVACHGQDGNSINPQFPKIAGQVPGYVATQLRKFQNGDREGPTMNALVKTLTEEDMADFDAYYSQFESTQESIAEEDLPAAMRGREIYRIGQEQYSIPACMSCHGPAGQGIPIRYPRIAGQYRGYIIRSLQELKDGRWVSEEMNPIAFRLTQQQIEDLATYLQGLN